MNKDIVYNKDRDEFIITLIIPRTQTGQDTYGDGEWSEDAVCIWINEKHEEYALSHTQYLDYKSSLQATQPIIYFDSKAEAEEFGKKHGLMIEYSSFTVDNQS